MENLVQPRVVWTGDHGVNEVAEYASTQFLPRIPTRSTQHEI